MALVALEVPASRMMAKYAGHGGLYVSSRDLFPIAVRTLSVYCFHLTNAISGMPLTGPVDTAVSEFKDMCTHCWLDVVTD